MRLHITRRISTQLFPRQVLFSVHKLPLPWEGCWFVIFRMLKSKDSRIQSSLLPVAFESNSVQNSCRKDAAEAISLQRGKEKLWERQQKGCLFSRYQCSSKAVRCKQQRVFQVQMCVKAGCQSNKVRKSQNQGPGKK